MSISLVSELAQRMMLATAVLSLVACGKPVGDESISGRVAKQDAAPSATKPAPDSCGEAHATEVVQYVQQLCDASG